MEDNQKISTPRKILRIVKWCFVGIGAAILLFLVVVVGWLSIDKYILKSAVPSFCGYSNLVVTTGSMNGTIDAGDIIIIKKTDDYKIGDIITFIKEGDTIPTTHRIINVDENGNFVTKGDANNSEDRFRVSNDEICGEVVYTIADLGIFLDWIQNGGGFIYIIAIIAIIGAGVYIIKLEDE